MNTARERQRARRARMAAGRRCLKIEVDVVGLSEALIAADMLDPQWDCDWDKLAAAIEHVLAKLLSRVTPRGVDLG